MNAIAQVQKRPGMYVGDMSDGTGLHNLVLECVHRACNLVIANVDGHPTRLEVVFRPDGSAAIRDNGRPRPGVGPRGRTVDVRQVLTDLLADLGPFRLDIPAERFLDCSGLCVVNALSSWLMFRTWGGGECRTIGFSEGVLTMPDVRQPAPEREGTEIIFEPSARFFPSTEFDSERLRQHLHPLVWLLPSLSITFTDERTHPRAVRLDGSRS